MAIKRGSKIEINGASASMTDLIFLLLIFFMIATTLINTNALKLQLPKSTNVVKDKTILIVSITPELRFFVDKQEVDFSLLESTIVRELSNEQEPVISLQADKRVPIGEVVKVMNIAKNNNYKLNLVTEQE